MRHRLSITRRGRKYRLRGTLCGSRVDRQFRSREAAEKERTKLEDAAEASSGLPLQVMTEARLAHDLLEHTCNVDAKGKSILEATRWYVANYRNTAGERLLSAYVDDYLKLMGTARERKTIAETRQYLSKLNECLPDRTPSSISHLDLDGHLESLPSRYHRDKCLRAFFSWLCGKRKKLAKPANPPLKQSPFEHIQKLEYRRRGLPKILTLTETKVLLQQAAKAGLTVPAMFGLNTGMRPEAELPGFLRDHGWSKIDFDRKTLVVDDDLEKTGVRVREITLRPGFLAWLKTIRGKPLHVPNLRRKWRALKKVAIAADKRAEQDLIRHTFLSNVAVSEGLAVARYQGATSDRMLLKFYLRAVPKNDARTYFRLGSDGEPMKTSKRSGKRVPQNLQVVVNDSASGAGPVRTEMAS